MPPDPDVNYAVNPLFASGTSGWRKEKLGSSFGFPTDPDGVTWGIPVWCNTLGTGPATGGLRRLISETRNISKPIVDDGVQPIYSGTTPGDSPYCGCTYIHSGAGFSVLPGEIWRFRCSMTRISFQDAIDFSIASYRNWGSLVAVSPKLAQLWMHNGDFQQRYDDYAAGGTLEVSKARFQQFELPVLAVGWNIANPLVDFAGWEYIDGGPDWTLIDPLDHGWNPPYSYFNNVLVNETIDYAAGIFDNSAGLQPASSGGGWLLTHGRESWSQQDAGASDRVQDPYLYDLGLWRDESLDAISLHSVSIDLYFGLPKWLYMGPVAPDVDGYGGWTCGDSEVVTFDPAGEPIYIAHAVGEDDAWGTGITFAVEPGVELKWMFTQGTPPPVVETTPPAAPSSPTDGPIDHPEPPTPTEPGEDCLEPVEISWDGPSWDGAPTITFPEGCASRILGVEFIAPTPTRDPWHIVIDPGDDGVQPGILPWIEAGLSDVWYGRGIRWYDLLIDGEFTQRIMADPGDPAPGETVNVNVYSNLEDIDFTAPHIYSLRATFEDVPPSITWIVDRTINNPTPSLPSDYYNIWKQTRATTWVTGYDPNDTSPFAAGEDWGAFGADEPTWSPGVGAPLPFLYHEVSDPGCSLTSDSPGASFTCETSGGGPDALYDPAAIAIGTIAPDTNPAPGFGTAPTPASSDGSGYGAQVFVSDDYGCGDLTSFRYEPPHGTFPGSGYGGYPFQWREDGGDLDTWYYMSAVLFFDDLGPRFDFDDPPDDPTLSDGTYLCMGMVGGDNILWPSMGLALIRDHGAADPFVVTSCFDNANTGAFYLGTDTFGDPAIPVVVGQPNCLQFAVKRVTDPGGSAPLIYWRFAVNGTATSENSWRPPPDFLSRLYGAPSFSFWGDFKADLTDSPDTYRDLDWRLATLWMDDLQWSSAVEVACNCEPRTASGIYLEPRTEARTIG